MLTYSAAAGVPTSLFSTPSGLTSLQSSHIHTFHIFYQGRVIVGSALVTALVSAMTWVTSASASASPQLLLLLLRTHADVCRRFVLLRSWTKFVAAAGGASRRRFASAPGTSVSSMIRFRQQQETAPPPAAGHTHTAGDALPALPQVCVYVTVYTHTHIRYI